MNVSVTKMNDFAECVFLICIVFAAVYYSKQDIETLGRMGRLVSEVFSVNHDWGVERQLEQKLHHNQIDQVGAPICDGQ